MRLSNRIGQLCTALVLVSLCCSAAIAKDPNEAASPEAATGMTMEEAEELLDQELFIDCNMNALGDDVDLAAKTDTDVNGNGVLDGCEPEYWSFASRLRERLPRLSYPAMNRLFQVAGDSEGDLSRLKGYTSRDRIPELQALGDDQLHAVQQIYRDTMSSRQR